MSDSIRDTGRVNRRDLIIETATRLFSEQGYTATSVRQIAEVVGCTEAALYYHFKEGKRALLQSVLECEMPKTLSIIETDPKAQSLADVVKIITTQMAQAGPERMESMRWILGEFHRLNDEEKALFHANHLHFHNRIIDLVAPFMESRESAEKLAWILMCSGFGYGQIFWNLEMSQFVNFPLNEFMDILMKMLVQPNSIP
ncbi:MAG: TetR/AcrR family transcriptional regulator [Chloroflexi bacterium]|nr:TetR/AcrR family transcriptional regulator [Chloroflexota bacterium]